MSDSVSIIHPSIRKGAFEFEVKEKLKIYYELLEANRFPLLEAPSWRALLLKHKFWIIAGYTYLQRLH